MELYLSNAWYIINPRELRSVKYYQVFDEKIYSPDTKFENLTDVEKESIKKIIEIELNDKIGEDGRRKANIIRINANDELYNYIYKSFARKFRLKYSNNKIDEKWINKLFEKDFSIDEISEILKMKKSIVSNIIETYKSKKNGI